MHIRSRVRHTLALAALVSVGATQAHAQSVYVTGNSGQFGTFDIGTGVYTNIATTSQTFFGIAFAPNGTLYGIDISANHNLYTINTTTGATTLVGSTGLANGAFGLASRSDGTFFTMDGTSNLYTVNTTTGGATLVGPIGNSSNGTLEFGADDTLYQTNTLPNPDTLNTLNQTTGAATLVGSTGFNGIFGLVQTNSALYGFNNVNQIFTLNTTTGAGTLVRTYSLPNEGIIEDAAVPIAQRSAPPVPEPGSIALLTGLSLTGAAFLRRRKAARQAA